MTLRRINTAETMRPRLKAWTSTSSCAPNERSICWIIKKLWNVFRCVFISALARALKQALKHIRTTRVVFTCIFSLFPRRIYSELQQQRSLVLEQVSVAPARHYCICSLWNTHLTGFMWGNATFSNRLDYLEYFRTGFVFPQSGSK